MPLPEQGVENNSRTEALADIYKSREAQIDRELKEGGTTEGIAVLARDIPEGDPLRPADIPVEDWTAMSDESKNQAITSAKAEKEAAKPEDIETPKETQDKPEAELVVAKKVKIKVDGVEQEVDETEVMQAGIRTMQKESAADKRLEDATKVREEAERLRAAAVQASTTSAQPAKKTDQELLVEKDALRGIVKAIQYGGEDEAAEALQKYGEKMAQLGQANALTKSELNNMLDLREAQKYVRTEYADVMGDDKLKKLFVSDVNDKLTAGDGRPYQEICKEVGDDLRKWKGAPPKEEPTPDKGGSRAAVHQRKTSTVHVPAAAARQQAPIQPKAESPTDTVQKMREERERRAGR